MKHISEFTRKEITFTKDLGNGLYEIQIEGGERVNVLSPPPPELEVPYRVEGYLHFRNIKTQERRGEFGALDC